MFYTQLFMSKRGPLAKIWLAAHWEKKITKAHVFECNLETTIKDIMSPQVKIGLRTSGHLLLGVVRIYSRKAKYLLADCNDAVLKIKVAFRPGQTDLPSENMEATFKAITLPEEFPDFDSQLPDVNAIEVADHFSLNQCRTEDITLKEDLGNSFLLLETDFGEESHLHQDGLFDVSFPSLATPGDGFGDEEMGLGLLDFMAYTTEDAMPLVFTPDDAKNEIPATPPPTAVSKEEGHPDAPYPQPNAEISTLDETTLLANEEEGFALEPVSVTPSSERKRVKTKRRLLVDREKELSNEEIRNQIADSSDLVVPLDMAPPTRLLMEWKETGGVEQLLRHHCVPVIHPYLKQLFPKNMLPRRGRTEGGAEDREPEKMRTLHESEQSMLGVVDNSSILQETRDRDCTFCSLEATPLQTAAGSKKRTTPDRHRESEQSVTEVSLPPSEDSMCVHPSGQEREPLLSQSQSALDSQDLEEKRITSRAQNLLHILRSQSAGRSTAFSLQELIGRCSRSQASATFYCFLVLKKQKALDLRQDVPYADITATPGPAFHLL
ncbi:double-strand-break repair protein rad21-like protein 1 [Megalops cyprinoides]|uniref:double-strand-break repair protein rad21-like protein 1 n=1 Tax=Megalops cyprinoides TaxID=118141 RepID=UPI001864A0CD|nr:double-strand-break repair protein rad21-like protein 1 [Megalops cyprinoides]